MSLPILRVVRQWRIDKKKMYQKDMEEALSRAYRGVPPATIDGYRQEGKTVALYIFKSDCPACHKFTKKRGEYEKTLDVEMVIPICADKDVERRMCVEAGVVAIPCYVILKPGEEPDIFKPRS